MPAKITNQRMRTIQLALAQKQILKWVTQRRRSIVLGEQSYLLNLRRHYTTTTEIPQRFSFLGRLGVLLFKPRGDYQIEI